MKKNLLVTLATKDYIPLAKQLFSSVYFNAGWKGDYMLLACQIHEKDLKWFRMKGILVKKYKPFYTQAVKNQYSFNARVGTLKFFLFTPEFKKWKNIIYLDADIIVRGSLEKLSNIKGFAAVPDSAGPLRNQFLSEREENKFIFAELKKNYDLNKPSFNSGVMAFSTKTIKKNMLIRIKALLKKYERIRITSDQISFNLLFYKKWRRLPFVYNLLLFALKTVKKNNLKNTGVKTIVLHFAKSLKDILDIKKKKLLYKEWRRNLYKAEVINLEEVLPPKNIWTAQKIKRLEKKYNGIYKRYLIKYMLQRNKAAQNGF